MDNLPVRSASVLMMSGGLQNLAGAAAIAAIEWTSINFDGQTIKAASWGSSAASAAPSLSRGQQHLFNLYRQHEVARSPLVRNERAGFSASWVETVIARALERGSATVFDPFAGAGTTLLAAEKMGVECLGVEAHPFVARIASAKLLYRTDPALYLEHIRKVKIRAEN